MGYDKQLITYRKRRRTRSQAPAWIAAVLVLAVLGTSAVLLAQSRSRAAAGARQSSSRQTGAVAPQSRLATESIVATPAAASDTSSSVTTATPPVKAKRRQSDAVSDAAVSFPGAPSVKPKTITRLNPRHKYIAITLDDGYGFQPEMLKLLLKYDARCTTFLLGQWVVNNPKDVRKIKKAKFEIANHTWDHKNLTQLSESEIRSELLRTQTAISEVTGNQAPYMRPPTGATDSRVRGIAADLGYKVVMWNRTFADSSPKASPERAYRSVMVRSGGVRPGDIILCHWGDENSYEALKRILPELKAQGYEFVTISELIADSKKHK